MSLGTQIANAKRERDKLTAEIVDLQNEFNMLLAERVNADANERYRQCSEKLSPCLLSDSAMAAWKSDIAKVKTRIGSSLGPVEQSLSIREMVLSDCVDLIEDLATTLPTGDDCPISWLPLEMLNLVFLHLPRHGYYIERVNRRFRGVINSLSFPNLKRAKLMNRLYRDQCEPRTFKSLRHYDGHSVILAGGDGNVWIHKNKIAIGTDVKTGIHTGQFAVPDFDVSQLKAVSPGGVMFFSNGTRGYISWVTPTGDYTKIFKVKGRLMGAVSDTSVVMHRITRRTGPGTRDVHKLVVVDLGTNGETVIFSGPNKLLFNNTGNGVSLRYATRTAPGTLERTTGYIKYSSPSVLTPTQYSTAGHTLSGVPVPGTHCNVLNTVGYRLIIEDIEDRHSEPITNDIIRLVNAHDHKLPRAVVVVGNVLVIAIANIYYVY
jgi:hypothetical protein